MRDTRRGGSHLRHTRSGRLLPKVVEEELGEGDVGGDAIRAVEDAIVVHEAVGQRGLGAIGNARRARRPVGDGHRGHGAGVAAAARGPASRARRWGWGVVCRSSRKEQRLTACFKYSLSVSVGVFVFVFLLICFVLFCFTVKGQLCGPIKQ